MAVLVNGCIHGRAGCNMAVLLNVVCVMALTAIYICLLLKTERLQHVALQIGCA